MNKFAEVMYGKIAHLYDTSRTIEEFRKLFTPAALILDVTSIDDVGVGYGVDFTSETEFNLIPPKKIIPPTQEDQWAAEAQSMRSALRERAINTMMSVMSGNAITEAQAEYQNELNSVSDDVALYMSDMFPAWSGASVEYKEGQRVLYNGVLYKVVKDHTSQETWKPDVTPSEYVKVISSISGEIPEWQQPLPTNAYKLGDRVKHNGRYYESTYDGANVWEPGVVGEEFWKDITDEIGEAS